VTAGTPVSRARIQARVDGLAALVDPVRERVEIREALRRVTDAGGMVPE
jgi:DNA mismatch repair ATPase MutS